MLYAKQGHVQEAICKVTLPYATLVLKPLVSACLCVHMSQVVVEALRCVALSILWKLHVFSEVAASRVSPVQSSPVQFSPFLCTANQEALEENQNSIPQCHTH